MENFLFIGHSCFRTATDISERECSKKFVQQGRSRFDARGALPVRERERREERQVCEPEGQAKGRRCLCEPLRQSQGTPLAAFFNIPRSENTMNILYILCVVLHDVPCAKLLTLEKLNKL